MFGIGVDQQNVVSMMTREYERRSAPMREVENYWRALCRVGDIPVRSQIDPRGIEGALEYAFLAERIAPGMARIRVAGSHLSDLMGMDVSGMPLSSLFAPTERERLAEHVSSVFAEPAILRAQLKGEDGFNKPDLQGQLLLLPLRSDMGDVSRALGCLITHGRIGRSPRRFLLDAIDAGPVRGKDAVPPRRYPPQFHKTATSNRACPRRVSSANPRRPLSGRRKRGSVPICASWFPTTTEPLVHKEKGRLARTRRPFGCCSEHLIRRQEGCDCDRRSPRDIPPWNLRRPELRAASPPSSRNHSAAR